MSKHELARARSSMVNIRVGDRVVPAFRSNRCKICTHPGRALIEERLLLNDTYPSIAEWASNHDVEEIDGARIEWPVITTQQVMHHYTRGHCPIDTKVLHELSEQRMQELGREYTDPLGRVVDHVVAAKLILARGQERLAKGEIQPDVRDTLAAAKLVHDIESSATQDDVDRLQDYVTALEEYFSVVQRIVTPDQWQTIGIALSASPVLQEIAARQQDIQDAELVGE